ncbi:MAG TPA: hypothetical protein VI757_12715 [Bacteroidia bacterium]|nr:hypothetical protein [Bacteroidia bacterium]
MSKAKVKIEVYMDLNIPGKIEYARDRVIDMTGNGNFVTPDVPLPVLGGAADDLELKYNKAQGGGPADTEAQNAAELVLDDLIRKEAGYVSRIADGDTVIITSSGFTPTKTEGTPTPPPAKVLGLTLTQTQQSGTIVSNCLPLEHAKGFITILSLTPTPQIVIDGNQLVIPAGGQNIIIHVSTTRKATHTGLTPGAKYYVVKFAFNAAGRGPDSDMNSIMVV